MQLLSYLTDGCNIADSAAIATTIRNYFLAIHRVASALLGPVPDRRIERVLVKREIQPCAFVSLARRFHLPGDHDELSSN